MINQVRYITLKLNDNREAVLYRLEKSWYLRFNLGPSLHTSKVRLFCNHPTSSEMTYKRETYYEVEWKSPSAMATDKTDIYADVHMAMAGSFNYFFTVDGSASPMNAKGLGYFLVDPVLSYGPNEIELSMDCLMCETVLAKLLGPLSQWESRLQVSREAGYNLIHFTPIQELGISNSAYSIRNHHALNPTFQEGGRTYTYSDVGRIVRKLQDEWRILCSTDLVFNHTAKDSPWIQKHPECVYNLHNSPHLRPAFLVDRIFHHFSREVGRDHWAHKGIPSTITKQEHLDAMKNVLHTEIFPAYKLHEFYSLDVVETMRLFKKRIEDNMPPPHHLAAKELKIIQDSRYRRGKSYVSMDVALQLYNIDREENSPGAVNRSERIRLCCQDLEEALKKLNSIKEIQTWEHLNCAIDNFIENVRWRFITPGGPKVGKVQDEDPLMWGYFVIPERVEGSVSKEEDAMDSDDAKYMFAVNGWVMGDDPLRNFAEEGSLVYLRRELLAWGDSVKLRYGKCPADCPYLWDYMREYSEKTASIFHGVRLDNCHSTPIHVAEYMMDAARRKRPDLYVVAELFTGSEHIDNLFINRLGINSLIREALNAWDAHEQGRLVHRYGGLPVGAFIQPRVQPLVPTMAHAIFFDQTHDNPSPVEKRSPYDLWPSSALVAMAACATGSNRGYDQLCPHHIDVVKETRLYTSWTSSEHPDEAHMNKNFGIVRGKTLLNKLHFEMGMHGYTQVYVDQLTDDVVTVTRHNPQTHHSIIMIVRTAFHHPKSFETRNDFRHPSIEGMVDEVIFEGSVKHSTAYKYQRNHNFINGLPDYYLELREKLSLEKSEMVDHKVVDGKIEIIFKNFPPGSVIALRTSLPTAARQAILEVRRGLAQFGYLMRSYSGNTMFDESLDSSFQAIVHKLSLADMNRVLFRCNQEELDDGNNISAYDIPSYGPTVFCGLKGVMTVLSKIRAQNDLGHPICGNLRDGNWLMDYISHRLLVHSDTHQLGKWFRAVFSHLKSIPRYLVPCYFDAIITGAYVVIRDRTVRLLSNFVKDGSSFVQALALGSVMFCGFVQSAQLPPLSPQLSPSLPRVQLHDDLSEYPAPLTISAGFPHFASGYMRNWGRDTFISLRGLLLLTGRFQDARLIILGYAGCLRHGLIPNLLNEGRGARYNCRDAVWWWLQSIQDYCSLVPDGTSILQDTVHRLYVHDDAEMAEPGTQNQVLHNVMQEALQTHALGRKYRERNAGHQIDAHMTDEGFNVEIGVDWKTGFVFGGNQHNCGTWMDKMGSSAKAGNKGRPATPRDGSAVEIVGLCKSAVTWLAGLKERGQYPFQGVSKSTQDGGADKITFKQWADLIQENFEKHFHVSNDPAKPDPRPDLINRKGIYKDTVGGSQPWADYQLRPNFPVAMVVAPELFEPAHAWEALTLAQEHLLGPLGMKTLDPSDYNYKGDYDNANDSHDATVAHGFNYHQGPEWVWPIGYFLRAKLIFAKKMSSKLNEQRETINFVESRLTEHHEEIMSSDWMSLPELTNSNGSFCRDSCRAQAWSVACVLEVLYELERAGGLC